MPGLQQSVSGCMCPLQAGSGNTWCLWAGWWWIPGGDGGYQGSLEASDLSPAENRILASLRNDKLSVFSLVLPMGRECNISILCLYFCLVCSIPTAPSFWIWTWGSSVCASVTLNLFTIMLGGVIQIRKKQNNTCVWWHKYKGVSKNLEKREKKDYPLSQLSLWKAMPFRKGAGWPGEQGRRKAKGPNYANYLTLTYAPHLLGRLTVCGSSWNV